MRAGPQDHDVLAIVHGDLGHAHTAALPQRFEEQSVGLFAAFIGRHVIGALKVDGVDLVGLHELQDLHHLGGFGRDLLDILIVDDDVFVFLVLVAFDDVAARDGLVFRLAIHHLLDARIIVFVQQVEADGFAAGRAEQFDGKRHQTKSQMSLPNGAGHFNVLQTSGRV